MEIINTQNFPYDTLKKMGIDMEELQHPTNLYRLSHGMRTHCLHYVPPFQHTYPKHRLVKIRLYRDLYNQNVKVKLYPYREHLDLDKTLFHLELTDDDQNILKKYHELGRSANLVVNGISIECLIGVDTDLNCLNYTPKSLINVNDIYLGQEISEKEKEIIISGGMVLKKGLINNGVPFDALVYYSNTTDQLCCRTITPELLMMVKNYKNKNKGESIYHLTPATQIKTNIEKTIREATLNENLSSSKQKLHK